MSWNRDSRMRLMPKVEIHVHLEGTMGPETVWQLASKNHVRLPVDSLEAWRKYYRFKDFAHFIDTYVLACQAIAKAEDFVYILDVFAAEQSAQNVRYSELFFSASLHLGRFSNDELVEALEEGIKRADQRHNIKFRIIPDIAREEPDSQERVLQFALKGRDKGIFIGLGLGGREAEYPAELFRETFAEAKRRGLHVVAHAGEVAGPASIWGALDLLDAERIGHGIRCLEDPELVNRLKQAAIPLEVCPVSNYCTGAVAADKPHPLRSLLAHGLRCTVSSDDPSMFGANLVDQYYALAAQGFTWDELWALNRATLNAGFLDPAERKELEAHWGTFEKSDMFTTHPPA
jgi:adenosine deaminase